LKEKGTTIGTSQKRRITSANGKESGKNPERKNQR